MVDCYFEMKDIKGKYKNILEVECPSCGRKNKHGVCMESSMYIYTYIIGHRVCDNAYCEIGGYDLILKIYYMIF